MKNVNEAIEQLTRAHSHTHLCVNTMRVVRENVQKRGKEAAAADNARRKLGSQELEAPPSDGHSLLRTLHTAQFLLDSTKWCVTMVKEPLMHQLQPPPCSKFFVPFHHHVGFGKGAQWPFQMVGRWSMKMKRVGGRLEAESG